MIESKIRTLCTVCGVELGESNWMPSVRSRNYRICRRCHNRTTDSWRHGHPQAMYQMRLRARLKLKQRVLDNLGGPICVRCGCNDIQILEVNHKNGGGTKWARAHYAGAMFYYDIIKGRRTTSDLEVLCKICNVIDDVKRRFQIDRHIVTWNELRDESASCVS